MRLGGCEPPCHSPPPIRKRARSARVWKRRRRGAVRRRVLSSIGGRGERVASALADAAGRATSGAGTRRLRDGLVIAEIAMAFVLSVGAALLIRELVRLRSTDPGLTARQVMTLHVGYRGPTQQ